MARRYTDLTFTDSVQQAQEHYGSRGAAARMQAFDVDDRHLGPREIGFLAERDGFYMATVGENGWPYVQFRGGPRGFLKALDDRTLAYADFLGNRQYISTGNLRHDGRVAMIFMDYAGRRRLKVMARARIFDAGDRPDLVEKLRDPSYPARIERVVLFEVEAFDWNCPQHITPRFTQSEILAREEILRSRIRELESRLLTQSAV